MFGSAVEDYMKAIYELGRDSGAPAPKAVAEVLGVSLPAVTKMVRRLSELRLVTYVRAEGIELTPAGRKVALEVLRHHRLLEVYLKEALGYSWDQVDEEAEKLEHHISEEFEDRIDRMLGFPTRDPHGAPIPTKDLRIDDPPRPTLADIEPGVAVRVARVSDRDPALLRYLGELGLYPEARVEILERAPFGGPLRLLVEGAPCDVGDELARHVFVEERGT
jgi:DtxR family transcriptional regulator, Mn-dependent transcriptional regulator